MSFMAAPMPIAGRPNCRWQPDVDDEPDISECERLEGLIALRRKRVGRADDKIRSAQSEKRVAETELAAAEDELAAWFVNNPDPQGSIFEELSDV